MQPKGICLWRLQYMTHNTTLELVTSLSGCNKTLAGMAFTMSAFLQKQSLKLCYIGWCICLRGCLEMRLILTTAACINKRCLLSKSQSKNVDILQPSYLGLFRLLGWVNLSPGWEVYWSTLRKRLKAASDTVAHRQWSLSLSVCLLLLWRNTLMSDN